MVKQPHVLRRAPPAAAEQLGVGDDTAQPQAGVPADGVVLPRVDLRCLRAPEGDESLRKRPRRRSAGATRCSAHPEADVGERFGREPPGHPAAAQQGRSGGVRYAPVAQQAGLPGGVKELRGADDPGPRRARALPRTRRGWRFCSKKVIGW